jgi:chromosome segregation ATPase/SAM-dependent methyltransferase
MGDQPYAGLAGHRLARYLFIESLLKRKRVLEVGCAGGEGLGLLLERGASQVVGVTDQADEAEAARAYLTALSPRGRWTVHHGSYAELPGDPQSYDLVLVPEVEPLAERGDFLGPLLAALKPDGVLMVAARNAIRRPLERWGLPDGGPGVDYGALAALLGEHFPRVRMIGQSPFLGSTLVDFEPEDELELEMDSSLLGEDGSEDVSYFMALASSRTLKLKGYSLVQVPYWATLERALGTEEGALDEEGAALGEADEAVDLEDAEANGELGDVAAGAPLVVHRAGLQTTEASQLRAALATAQQALDDTAARAQDREARIAELTAELQSRDWRVSELEGTTKLREQRLRDIEERLAEAEAAVPELDAAADAAAIQNERLLQDLRVKLQAREAAAAELRLSLDEWMSRGGETEKVRAQLEARLLLIEGELRARVVQVRDLESERAAHLARTAELEGTLGAQRARTAELERSLTDRARRLGELEAQGGPARPSAELQAAEEQRRALQARIDAQTAQLATREDRIAELTRIIGDKDQFIARRVDEHEAMVRRLSAAEVERKQAQQDTKEYEGKLKTRDLQIKQLENANRDSGLQLRQLQRTHEELKSRAEGTAAPTAATAPAGSAPAASDNAEVSQLRERLDQAEKRASALAAACDRARDELREVMLRESQAASHGAAAAAAPPAPPVAVQELEARARAVDDLLRAAEQHAAQARDLEARLAEQRAYIAELEDERRGHQGETDRLREASARAEATAAQAELELRKLRSQLAETEGRLRNLQLRAASGGAGELAEAAWKDRVEQLERELSLRNRQRAELERDLKQERHRADDAATALRAQSPVAPVVTEVGSKRGAEGGTHDEPPFGTARARAEAPAVPAEVVAVGAADVHTTAEAAQHELRRLQQGDAERREELRLLRREMRERDGERERLETEIARGQDQLLLVQRELVSYGERLARSEEECEGCEGELQKARQALAQAETALDAERKVRTQDGNRVVELARERERRDAEIARLGQELSSLRTQKERLQGELAAAQSELTESRRSSQKAEQRAQETAQNRGQLESELEQSRERERKMQNELEERKERIKELKRQLEAEEKRASDPEPAAHAGLRSRMAELESQLGEARASASRERHELETRHRTTKEGTDKRIADLEAELNWRLHEGRAREAAATEAFREREETIFRLENRVAELEGDLHRKGREVDALKRAQEHQQAVAAQPSEPGTDSGDGETGRLKKRIAELEGEIVWRGHEYQARDQAQTEALKTRDKEIERLSSRVAQLEAARAGQAHGRPGLGGEGVSDRQRPGHDAEVAEAHAREELLRREIERTQDKMRRLAEELSDKDAELLALFSEVEGQRRVAQRVQAGVERLRRRFEENCGDVEGARLADELGGLFGGEGAFARAQERQ